RGTVGCHRGRQSCCDRSRSTAQVQHRIPAVNSEMTNPARSPLVRTVSICNASPAYLGRYSPLLSVTTTPCRLERMADHDPLSTRSGTPRLWQNLAEVPPFTEHQESTPPPPGERMRATITDADAVPRRRRTSPVGSHTTGGVEHHQSPRG